MAGNFPTTETMSTATIEKPKISAATAIRELAERKGTLTAEIVLEAAKPKNSPLHSHFDWNDTAAARKYRLIQAAELIRRIKVEYEISDTKTVTIRAFHNVVPEERPESTGEEIPASAKGFYVPLETALSVESYRSQLLANCKRDMASFRQKYSALNEIGDVISVIDQHLEA